MQFTRNRAVVVISAGNDKYFIPPEQAVHVVLKDGKITIAFDKHEFNVNGDEHEYGLITELFLQAQLYRFGIGDPIVSFELNNTNETMRQEPSRLRLKVIFNRFEYFAERTPDVHAILRNNLIRVRCRTSTAEQAVLALRLYQENQDLFELV